MSEIIEQKNPVCLMCKHYLEDWKCEAFDKIPIEILRGESDHDKVIEGQKKDVIFEPLSE